MGVKVSLTVQLGHISPREWEAAYQDSLALLQSFPGPLVCREAVEHNGHRRFRLTEAIVRDAGTEEEHWIIDGDRASGRLAERFSLPRDIRQYWSYVAADGEGPAQHVLWVNPELAHFPEGNGQELFGNKTQGYPYHLALVAVGILFEDRFPDLCFLGGDIDAASSARMAHWVNAVLGRECQLPICCDGPRLYQRLRPLYDDELLAIQRFQALFRGEETAKLRTLFAYADPDKCHTDLLAELNSYESLAQWGAKGLLEDYLRTAGDVGAVINLVIAANEVRSASPFSLEDLLRGLCRDFVCIGPAERWPLVAWPLSKDRLASIDDVSSEAFLTLTGVPKAVDFHREPEALLEDFAARDPARRERYRGIIATETEHCRQVLAETASLLEQIGAMSPPDPTSARESETPAEGDQASGTQGASWTYIRQQIDYQQKRVQDPEAVADALGEAVGRAVSGHPELFAAADPLHYRDLIDQAAQQQVIVLWRGAWEAIDQEAEPETLKALAGLALIDSWEANFCNWRIHLLEHPELWPRFTASVRAAP